jgi:hypothetical protein
VIEVGDKLFALGANAADVVDLTDQYVSEKEG